MKISDVCHKEKSPHQYYKHNGSTNSFVTKYCPSFQTQQICASSLCDKYLQRKQTSGLRSFVSHLLFEVDRFPHKMYGRIHPNMNELE